MSDPRRPRPLPPVQRIGLAAEAETLAAVVAAESNAPRWQRDRARDLLAACCADVADLQRRRYPCDCTSTRYAVTVLHRPPALRVTVTPSHRLTCACIPPEVRERLAG